jgi:hypothetical protein
MSKKPCDIMIDLETVGKRAGCAILSIGAVALCPIQEHPDIDGNSFYTIISLPSCYALKLEADIDTLAWWSKQDAAVIQQAFSGHRDIKEALINFAGFLYQWPNKRVWGNSASFDLKILEAAYLAADIPVPWTYREEMCYRTLKNLLPEITAPVANTCAHDALADAQFQATHLTLLLNHLDTIERN